MNVAELIEASHKQAKISGFWGTENVGEKLALVATEIMEYEDAVTEAGRLEEAADIVIRVFDLCGYLQLELPEDVLFNAIPMVPPSQWRDKDFPHRAYRLVACATQKHRKWDLVGTRESLRALVVLCAVAMGRLDDREVLLGAILEKMEKNAGRPHLHNRRY